MFKHGGLGSQKANVIKPKYLSKNGKNIKLKRNSSKKRYTYFISYIEYLQSKIYRFIVGD